MKCNLDCVSCFVRQALQAARFVSDDVALHERVVRQVLQMAATMDFNQPPPVMARAVQQAIREFTGSRDPYEEVKRHFNQYALGLLDGLRRRVDEADDPFDAAVRVAIAGNVIDFGPFSTVDKTRIVEAVTHAMDAPLPVGATDRLRQQIEAADDILYLADNAGEIVFDRVLIERMPREKITLVVKGGPVLNDVMMADAEEAGLTELVTVVDNGSDATGTVLELCPKAFQERFQAASLIIAKGQANYETLSDVDANIFFLLKVKCQVIARDIGCDEGELVVRHGRDNT